MNELIPIACYLNDKELQARRKNYLIKTGTKIIDSTELNDGFRFRFPLEDSMLHDLAEIIDLERKCCPFLNFRLDLESGKDSVWLELTGAKGAKELIRELFEWKGK